MNAPPAISLNFAFTTTQVAAAMGALLTLFGSGAFAGWLFIPAKDRDLQDLKAIVETIRADQITNKQNVERLSLAIEGLTISVSEMRNRPTAIAPRKRAPNAD